MKMSHLPAAAGVPPGSAPPPWLRSSSLPPLLPAAIADEFPSFFSLSLSLPPSLSPSLASCHGLGRLAA
nr:unnamed protein product [Digitaria exilis]